MKKNELIKELSVKAGISQKEAKEIYEALGEVYAEGLKAQGSVPLFDLGKLEIRKTSERKGVNPSTREEIIIPAGHRVAFKANSKAKELAKSL